MDESSISRLTDGQLACLRLVLEHKQTKEIARELGIAPDTVKQRLGIAMRTLGVGTRVEAALLLQRHEKDLSSRGVYPPSQVVRAHTVAADTGLAERGVSDGTDGTEAGSNAAPNLTDLPIVARGVAETEAEHIPTLGGLKAILAAILRNDRPEPAGAGVGNRLSAHQRILLIVLVAIGSILSLTGLVSAAKELVLLRR